MYARTGVRSQGLDTKQNPQHAPQADYLGEGSMIEQLIDKRDRDALEAKRLPPHRVVIESHVSV